MAIGVVEIMAERPATGPKAAVKSAGKFFWSCKLKQPETLKRHRTFETAAKRVGDHGFVYSEVDGTVKQVFLLSNGSFRGYDVDRQARLCNTGGFDMREVLRNTGTIQEDVSCMKALEYYQSMTVGKERTVSLSQDEECAVLKSHDYGVDALNEHELHLLNQVVAKLKDQIKP